MPWIAGIEFVASAKPLYGLGDKGETESATYRYVRASGAVSVNAALRWGSDWDAAQLSTGNDDIGAEVGVATVAAVDDEYLWALVAGKTDALSMAVANTTLRAAAAANAGYVDDAGTGPVIAGFVTTEDAAAMGSAVEAVLTYPTLQAAGGGGGTPTPLSDDNPEDVGTADPGSSTEASRADHVHGGGGGGTPTPLSDDDPQDPGTTTPGTSTEASRSDHVHASDAPSLSDNAPEDVGTASAGTSTEASRSDHVHAGGGGTGTLNVTTETVKVVRQGTTFEVVGTVLESHSSNSNAHGLGAVPHGIDAYLECTTADKDYAVGDKVHMVQPAPWRETIWYDDTNLYVVTKNQGWGIIDKGSTTGDSGNFDLSDWKLVITPYIYEDKTVVTGVTLS